MIPLGKIATIARAASLGLVAFGCASPAAAPQPATAATGAAASPGRRAPAAILADAVAATGGVEGWRSHRSVHQKLVLTLKGMAMSGPVEHFQTNTDKSLTVTTLPAVGETRDGSNGSVLWAQDPVNGTRLLEGAEAEQARIEAAWNLEMEAPALFAKIETAPETAAGLECLVLTPKIAPPMRACYDRQTHLEVSLEGTRATPQGQVPFNSTVSDWRPVGGLRIPYASQMQAGPVTIVTALSEIAFDEPLDDKMFDPPSAVGAAPGAPLK
ncbi:MAG: hypothetical protein ABUS79_20635 [Pseudomonadota bacterium]